MKGMMLLLVTIFVLFSCSQNEDKLEDLPLLKSRSFMWADRVESSDSSVFILMNRVYLDPVGKYLMDNIFNEGKKVVFMYDSSLASNKMKMTEVGLEIRIRYNFTYFEKNIRAYQVLLFHELFHSVQKSIPALNAEIEAYMAQLHYAMRLGYSDAIAGGSPQLWSALKNLHDWLYGNNSSRDVKEFERLYFTVMMRLAECDPDYTDLRYERQCWNFDRLDKIENEVFKKK